ncbi:MAG: AraC family ligand binding domain-containing protein [Chloroflexi bacterium]|nr:AraC family ligand binding domain-containing protein [Chloroflexota bacterium]
MRILELGFSTGKHEEMGLYNTGHRHNDIELNFLTSGSMVYAFAGKQHLVPPHRLTVFWAAIPHRLIYVAPASQLYWVTIPLSFFTNWDLPNGMVKSVLNGSFLQEPSDVFEQLDLFWFRQWNEDLSSKNKMHSRTVLLEIEARLRRLSGELSTSQSTVYAHAAHHGHNIKLHTAQSRLPSSSRSTMLRQSTARPSPTRSAFTPAMPRACFPRRSTSGLSSI